MSFLEIAGITFIILLSMALAMFLCGWFIEWLDDFRRDTKHRRGWDDRGDRLAQDAHWFSEDPATYELLRDLSDNAEYTKTINQIRDEWRDRRAKKPTQEKTP